MDSALAAASREDLEAALWRLCAQVGEEAVLTCLAPRAGDQTLASGIQAGGFKKKKKKNEQRDFVMDNYRQRHIAVRIMYDGRRFAGFAAQTIQGGPVARNGPAAQEVAERRLETIEKHLKQALLKSRLFGAGSAPRLSEGAEPAGEDDAGVDADGTLKLSGGNGYSRCGRTDRGVSALGQVSVTMSYSRHASARGIQLRGRCAPRQRGSCAPVAGDRPPAAVGLPQGPSRRRPTAAPHGLRRHPQTKRARRR